MQIERVLADLKDRDIQVKRLAIKAILKDSEKPDDIMATALESADSLTKEIVYDEVFNDTRDFSSLFFEATKDADPRIRATAIRYLFQKNSLKMEDALTWLEDGDPYVRRRTLSYLAWTTEVPIKKISRLALADNDLSLRKEALRVLGVKRSREAVGDVIKVLNDAEGDLKVQAIKTLEKITGVGFGEAMGASDEELEWISAKWISWWDLTGGGN